MVTLSGSHRRAAGATVASLALWLGLVLASGVNAAGPPFPDPVAGQRVYDAAGVF